MIDSEQRDNATVLWTWERLHDKTQPYCIRGDEKYPSLTYVPRYQDKYCDALVHMSNWFKAVPGVAWLN